VDNGAVNGDGRCCGGGGWVIGEFSG